MLNTYFGYHFMIDMEINVDQMYNIENKGHDMGFLKKFMMENAGAAAVRRLLEKMNDVKSKNILIFVGLGNNGGDGLVMARHLAGYDAKVTVMLLGSPEKIKTEESNWNWSILQKMPSVKLMSGDSFKYDFKPDVIVDGILGTGISGDIREPYASAINFINEANCYKFAVAITKPSPPLFHNPTKIKMFFDSTSIFSSKRLTAAAPAFSIMNFFKNPMSWPLFSILYIWSTVISISFMKLYPK